MKLEFQVVIQGKIIVTMDLARIGSELQVIKGILIAVIDTNVKAGNFKPDSTIENKFPFYCEMLEAIKCEMQNYQPINRG